MLTGPLCKGPVLFQSILAASQFTGMLAGAVRLRWFRPK
jgi:hypothetical protein